MANTPTPNVGLNKPAQGDTPWDATVNGNMDRLDAIFGGTFTVPAITVTNETTTTSTIGTATITTLKATAITQYSGIVTAGQGVAPILGATSQKTESAADTNVLTVTPPAVAGSYRLRFVMAVSAQSAATLGWTATWKDSNSAAQAPTNLALFVSGTAAPALTFVAVTNGNYYGEAYIDIDNSATAIVVKLTFSGTSFTAKVTATVERLV